MLRPFLQILFTVSTGLLTSICAVASLVSVGNLLGVYYYLSSIDFLCALDPALGADIDLCRVLLQPRKM